MGSSEIVREIPDKRYSVRQIDNNTNCVLSRVDIEVSCFKKVEKLTMDDGYSVQLLGQKKQFTEQYLRLQNGIEKSDVYSLNASVCTEYCKVCYRTRRRELTPQTCIWGGTTHYDDNDYYYVVDEYHVKNMVKLQRSDIEKALTEIWQARGSKD